MGDGFERGTVKIGMYGETKLYKVINISKTIFTLLEILTEVLKAMCKLIN